MAEKAVPFSKLRLTIVIEAPPCDRNRSLFRAAVACHWPPYRLQGGTHASRSGAALAALVITPSLADYYIVQEPSTKRCRIVEERPAPGVGVVIGGVGFGVRTEAETRMRTECRETGTTGSDVTIEERRPAR